MATRKAIHAGSWYLSSNSALASQLDGWLSSAEGTVHSPARAVIAPHAGYSYCGACAAFAYKQVDPSDIKCVFILGPSHHVFLTGCALSSTTHYETPLYDLDINQTIYTELLATGQFERMSQAVDEEEHSIEMHLPYIAKVMESRRGQFTIVPVLVGALKEIKEIEYGKIFSKYLADPQNLFVVSSDFCHWGKRFRYTHHNKADGPVHASIEALDKTGMSRIESLDPRAFTSYLEETHNTICGRHPISVLLNAVEDLQQSQEDIKCALKFVRYDQSNRCKSLSDSSVSYASASLTIS